MVEHLPGKHKALSLKPHITKKIKISKGFGHFTKDDIRLAKEQMKTEST
jgi:hypothetical protein